jgi:hypothetical protein
MGWSISNQINDVIISDECAKDLFVACPDAFNAYNEDISEEEQIDCVREGDVLFFDCDHMEHMDYVGNDEVLAVLLKHKVNGDIGFSSADGDNSGENWGYRFRDGVMTRLRGEVQYIEVVEDSE